MIRPLVEQFVAEAVATADINSELRESFKRHDRYSKFVDHITDEANKLPSHMANRDTLRDVCYEFTHIWLGLVERHANERMMSDAEKIAIKNAQAKAAKEESIVHDMLEGNEIDAERIAEVADDG